MFYLIKKTGLITGGGREGGERSRRGMWIEAKREKGDRNGRTGTGSGRFRGISFWEFGKFPKFAVDNLDDLCAIVTSKYWKR